MPRAEARGYLLKDIRFRRKIKEKKAPLEIELGQVPI
jgi:hypothetical protein